MLYILKKIILITLVVLQAGLYAAADNEMIDDAGVKWVSRRSIDGRFLLLTFEASLGQQYTIERSRDLFTWDKVETYWGFGQTIRYAIYRLDSGKGTMSEPVVDNPAIKFANLQIIKVATGGTLLVWPSLSDTTNPKVIHHFLPTANLVGDWPPLTVGVYGNYHISLAYSKKIVDQVPVSMNLSVEDQALVNQFEASLPEMNSAVARSDIHVASVVTTGLADESQFYFRVRRDFNLDSDGDGLSNEVEIETFGTNWLAADSDFDGILDPYEVSESLVGVLQKDLASKADLVDGRILTDQLPARTYLLLGQSNALGNAPIVGSDNTPRPSIQIFNRATEKFENWDINNPVPGMGVRENFAYRFAQQMEKIGVNTRFIVSAVSGTSIRTFLPVTGSNMLKLEADLLAAGVTQIDGVLWMQGETDGYALMAASTYKANFDTIRNHVSSLVGNKQTPWVVGELAAGLNSQDSKNVVFDSYAGDPLVRVMPNRYMPTLDGIHFTGNSLVEMGAMAFAAMHGIARTESDPVLYQQWQGKVLALKELKLSHTGSATSSTDSGYLRMNISSPGDKVKADMLTTGFALKIGTSQSSRFDLYGARVSFRIPSLFPENTTLILNLGVHPTVDMSGNLTDTKKGIQLRITKNMIVLASSDGSQLTESSAATAVSAGLDIDSFVVEIKKDKVMLYRSKENMPSNVILECNNVPQGDYGGYSYGANLYFRADAGAQVSSLYIDLLKIETRKYGL